MGNISSPNGFEILLSWNAAVTSEGENVSTSLTFSIVDNGRMRRVSYLFSDFSNSGALDEPLSCAQRSVAL